MKLLLFSDLHADKAAARRLVDRASQADVVIGAGDFGNGRRQVNVCIDVLQSITKPSPKIGASPVVNVGPAGMEWLIEVPQP